MGVLYVFHQNTNLSREAGAVGRRRDLRVGVLACRTPHRPNPVGLSLARVLHVDAKAGRVTLGGLDVVDGTPCLDLKPYLPSYEALPDATVPYWVEASYKEPLMRVEWSPSATTAFRALLGQDGEGGGSVRCKPFEDCDALRRALEGTLALDIRSSHQRDRHPIQSGSPNVPFFEGDLWFHEVHVLYSMFPTSEPGPPAWVRVEHIESEKDSAEAKGTSESHNMASSVDAEGEGVADEQASQEEEEEE